ncbi:hypothetical protein D9619_001964 [Psilocybe cf. subviscida]|uniref:Uncharacterized protein n=1 Tax=Psilocybe cf. subviscida TaxID=2480587 RepID=A0A8H5BCQ3_9AGAR|nr:hypothetical protein D9619_001964 [Psilocybe cf. subviscida]
MAEEDHGTEPTAQDALADVTYTLAYITDAFATLEECIDASVAFPPESVDLDEIKQLLEQISDQDRILKESLAQVQKSLLDETDREATASTETALRTYAAQWIREEVALQVKEQVDVQIVEHLPESLQKQADDTKRQLEEIKVSLRNSESRMINSFIQNANTNDRLAVLLNTDGQKSPLYPANSRSLFGYDLDSAKSLCKDYDLPETDDLFMNFRQFLKHVGTDIEVGISPS